MRVSTARWLALWLLLLAAIVEFAAGLPNEFTLVAVLLLASVALVFSPLMLLGRRVDLGPVEVAALVCTQVLVGAYIVLAPSRVDGGARGGDEYRVPLRHLFGAADFAPQDPAIAVYRDVGVALLVAAVLLSCCLYGVAAVARRRAGSRLVNAPAGDGMNSAEWASDPGPRWEQVLTQDGSMFARADKDPRRHWPAAQAQYGEWHPGRGVGEGE